MSLSFFNRACLHKISLPYRASSIPARRVLVSLMLGVVCAIASLSARADLMLHPTRVVFESNQRAAQLELINNGKETATYRITMVNRRMNEIGEFATVDTPLPGEQFADHMLSYSPRQVVLAPGEAQTVRIMLRKPADLGQGEYRSHLQFTRVPEINTNNIDSANQKAEPNAVGVDLKALIGVSIPVIVRHGDTSAEAALTNMRLQPTEAGQAAIVMADLQRSGNRSLYGDLLVTFVDHTGKNHELGMAGGLAVYTPNPFRKVKMALQLHAGIPLEKGRLRMVYRERLEAGGRVLAEATLALP